MSATNIAVAFGKVGMQHSIVRYQSEIAAGKSAFTAHQLRSTTFFGMLGTSLVVMILMVATILLVPARWVGGAAVRGLFALASLLVVVQVVESTLTNFLRAEQRTTVLMTYQVAKKYLGLGLIIGVLLLVVRSLAGFYAASVSSEAIAVAVLAWIFFHAGGRERPAVNAFSRPLYRQLLGFGIPMMIGYELSGTVLSVGDRYVIEGLIGDQPLGLYSAAYNLCQYVQAVVIASVGQAIVPLYMQMWDQKGRDETAAFIARSLRTYLLLGAPVVAGLAAVGPELLPSLASDKYASAGALLPWIIAGMVVDGANAMVGAGLFIHRKTRVIMIIVMCCAALNIGLNLVMVPRIGILGSAIATLVSYAAVALSLALAGHRLLPVPIPWATLLRSGVAATIMYLVLEQIYPGRRFVTVGLRIAAGAPLYALLMALIDPDARLLARKLVERLRRSPPSGAVS